MKKLLLGLCSIMIGLMWALPAFKASRPNTITKLFQHESALGDKLVLYFQEHPVCNRMAAKPGATESESVRTVKYFCPQTKVSARDVADFNNAKRPYYVATIKEVTKPMQGAELTISYDPRVLEHDVQRADPTHTHKGMIFYLHNKAELAKLHKNTGSILRLAKSDAPTVVIDCGHGGDDPGKVGCFGIKEKDVTLAVGKQLASLLDRQGIKTQLSRHDDSFVSLQDRVRIANLAQADLFVSLHANAAGKDTVHGIETFCINKSLFRPMEVDANASDLTTQFLNYKHRQGMQLAQSIHDATLSSAQTHAAINDRKVKAGMTQVLVGTDMSSALIELGFLTNPDETRRLSNPVYQQSLAQGLCNGITSFCKRNQLL